MPRIPPLTTDSPLNIRGEGLEELDACFARQFRGWITHPHHAAHHGAFRGFPGKQSNQLSFANGGNALYPAPMLGEINGKPFVSYLPFIGIHQEHQGEPDGTAFGLAVIAVGVFPHTT